MIPSLTTEHHLMPSDAMLVLRLNDERFIEIECAPTIMIYHRVHCFCQMHWSIRQICFPNGSIMYTVILMKQSARQLLLIVVKTFLTMNQAKLVFRIVNKLHSKHCYVAWLIRSLNLTSFFFSMKDIETERITLFTAPKNSFAIR